ncbi:MAG: DEAD/DEAH box helicase [Ignisphaera sp.]|nr:DEAD/DEAH box helicase [Ignisphaera sp.]
MLKLIGMVRMCEEVVSYYMKLGFQKLTEIQRVACTKILSHDYDLIISAPTGSGKTEAVLVPLLTKISKEGLMSSMGFLILYVTPLRALNRDIGRRIENICAPFGCSVGIWHGDTPSSSRKKVLREPPQILITTPESLNILLIKKELHEYMRSLRAIIIDEAQEITQSERGTELVILLERLDIIRGKHIRRIALLPLFDENSVRNIGAVLFSGRMFDIAMASYTKRYEVEVVLSNDEYRWGIFEVNDVVKRIVDMINYRQLKQVLVFTNTRTSAEELSFAMQSFTNFKGDLIGLHHGSLSRSVREEVERKLREGRARTVIATSSLELGIDIGTIDLVIQYLSPRQTSRLMQRVGRAGHREGQVSRGLIIVPPLITELIESIIIAKRLKRGNIEPINVHKNSLDVLMHQFIGLTLERDSISLSDFLQIIKSTTVFDGIGLDEVSRLARFANEIGLAQCEQNEVEVKCKPTKRGYIYYVTTNMIPDTQEYQAKSVLDHKVIAMLDESFVSLCNTDDVIVLSGKAWRVVDVDYEDRVVWLSPLLNPDQAILPKWVGENIPVDWRTSREICSFIRRFCSCATSSCIEDLFNEYDLNDYVRNFLAKYRNEICKVYPNDNVLTIELLTIPNENRSLVGFYHCLGTKGSEAFSLLLAKVFRDHLQVGVTYKAHQLGTIIIVNRPVTADEIRKVIAIILGLHKKGKIEEAIIDEIKKASFFKKRVIEVAKKMGVLSKNASSEEIRKAFSALLEIEPIVNEALRETLTENVDINIVGEYIKKLERSKKIRIVVAKSASPFLYEISQLGAFRYIIRQSMMPKNLVIELSKHRILSRKVHLFCLMCGATFSIKLDEFIKQNCMNKAPISCEILCPNCKSKLLTIIENNQEVAELKSILIKAKKDGPNNLNPDERNKLRKAMKIANLVMEYGIAAVIALQGIGIGPETAKKVLANSNSLDELILNIIHFEEQFLRTRKYWD